MPNYDESCEVCGRETNQLFKRIIDSVLMRVCSGCKQYGDEPPEVRRQKIENQQQNSRNQTFHSMTSNASQGPNMYNNAPKKTSRKPDNRFTELKVVDDAPKKLLTLRTSLGLSTEKFAETLSIKRNYYVRIEKGETFLTIDMARNIETKYKIKLVEKELQDNDDDYKKFIKKGEVSGEGMVYFRKRGQAPEYDQDLTKP